MYKKGIGLKGRARGSHNKKKELNWEIALITRFSFVREKKREIQLHTTKGIDYNIVAEFPPER